MKVEDQIQLADIAEVLIQYFDEHLHEFQDDQLVVVLVHDGDEVQTGVALVYDFVFLVVKEVAHLGVSGDDQLVDLLQGRPTSFRMRCFSDCDRF